MTGNVDAPGPERLRATQHCDAAASVCSLFLAHREESKESRRMTQFVIFLVQTGIFGGCFSQQ